MFEPSRELCCLQNGNVIFVCVKEIVNLSYQFSSREKKMTKIFMLPKVTSLKLLYTDMFFFIRFGEMEVRKELHI